MRKIKKGASRMLALLLSLMLLAGSHKPGNQPYLLEEVCVPGQ